MVVEWGRRSQTGNWCGLPKGRGMQCHRGISDQRPVRSFPLRQFLRLEIGHAGVRSTGPTASAASPWALQGWCFLVRASTALLPALTFLAFAAWRPSAAQLGARLQQTNTKNVRAGSCNACIVERTACMYALCLAQCCPVTSLLAVLKPAWLEEAHFSVPNKGLQMAHSPWYRPQPMRQRCP